VERIRRRLGDLFLGSPLLRRFAWYTTRVRRSLDRRFFLSLLRGAFVLVFVAALLITVVEKPWTLEDLGRSFYWGIQTILGQGDSSYPTSPIGYAIGFLFSLFGIAIIGTVTGALVALVIDFLIKEGQGLGASGYRDHIVICGWNATARDLVDELRRDDVQLQLVLISDAEKSPAGEGVYFVKGDSTSAEDLERTGIREASAALVFPNAPTNDADMHSILTIMAIESVAPGVRTVAEVINPRHVDHFRRADVDEILVTSRLASRLLARSALYPGLSELVTDIVSGGEGSELYRVALPDEFVGMSIDAVAARLRADHRATLISINRGGRAFVNPPADFQLEIGDDAIVVAESLGELAPLDVRHVEDGQRSASVVPSA
jgi:voltage-gated potassium channel